VEAIADPVDRTVAMDIYDLHQERQWLYDSWSVDTFLAHSRFAQYQATN
jgi:hypothetical protein